MELVTVLMQYGALGAVTAVCLVQLLRQQTKMYQIIEKNTEAMVKVKETMDKLHDTIEHCQDIHRR